MSDELLMTPKQVQDEFGIPTQALANWRWAGNGPSYIKTSPSRAGRVLYSRSAIAEWLKANTVQAARA
ncbi:helix-turn-helix domain-containing protein [Streptomyces stelliscabiei]|uniref:helix-turn-helix domain-containing protein n=1 Tax=Streptomyces stelliscabiei TaxID=146820 RepID=UPI0029A92127|nr:helix-turn-helix domain-containing protein [Streptomyces stelliscabiei]MDX2639917.1 helix-turn-helix domain-containing protein [Streptomyces stelliscabiei]MDX2662831.1 helix-turn-helix domain-containing protein [Streptomyces stelliscabiei]MDX2714497.1 helix-turn-helix domain-containing protein [Streptomyces stelliscabiei]MDX2792234.1 helix-turn-helix domain-containing protein [Streptomyces stelliscabiei]